MFDKQETVEEKLLKNPWVTVYCPASDIIVIFWPLIGSTESRNTIANNKNKYKVKKLDKLVNEQLLFAIAIYVGLLKYFGFIN